MHDRKPPLYSENVEKGQEIFLLRFRQSELEHEVEKFHGIFEGQESAVMQIGW